MTPEIGRLVTIEMKKRFTGPKVWAVENGFSPRTVNQLLHHGLGSRRGGEATEKIFAKLIADEYIDENHQLIERHRQAS